MNGARDFSGFEIKEICAELSEGVAGAASKERERDRERQDKDVHNGTFYNIIKVQAYIHCIRTQMPVNIRIHMYACLHVRVCVMSYVSYICII